MSESPTSLFRAMRASIDGHPELGASLSTLGARAGKDIPVDEDGLVRPATGGMSVTPGAPWQDKEPLVVRAVQEGDQLVFRVDETMRPPAATVEEVRLPVTAVRVDLPTLEMFHRLHGDLVMHLLPTLTGRSRDELRRDGGVRLIDAAGQLVWEWPRRSS